MTSALTRTHLWRVGSSHDMKLQPQSDGGENESGTNIDRVSILGSVLLYQTMTMVVIELLVGYK